MQKQTPNVTWEEMGYDVRFDIGIAKHLCDEIWVRNWYRDSYKGGECPSVVVEAIADLTEHFTQLVDETVNSIPKGLTNRIYVIRPNKTVETKENEHYKIHY